MNKADWADWLSHPVTKHYKELLDRAAEEWAFTHYDPDSVERTALDAAYRTGIAHGLDIAKTMEFTDGTEGSDS